MLRKGIQVLGSRILVLGFTFKENCPDVRNTKVIDIVKALKEYNLTVDIHDPWASAPIAAREYGVDIINTLPEPATDADRYDAVILAVAHREYATLSLAPLLRPLHVIYGVKWLLPSASSTARL